MLSHQGSVRFCKCGGHNMLYGTREDPLEFFEPVWLLFFFFVDIYSKERLNPVREAKYKQGKGNARQDTQIWITPTP